MNADKIKEICLEYQVVDIDASGAIRIAKLFMPIFISNLKKRRRMLDAIAISINQFCPEASILEKAVLSATISQMISNCSKNFDRVITIELQQDKEETTTCDKEFLRIRDIKTLDDVLARIQEEHDAK